MTTTLVDIPDFTRGDDIVQPYAVSGLDITGASIIATFRDAGDDSVCFTLANSLAGGDDTQCVITDGPSGAFRILISPERTYALTIRTGHTKTLRYDVQLTTSAGKIYTIALGKVSIYGDATRFAIAAPSLARRYVVIGDSTSSDPFATDLTIVPWVRRFATRLRGATPYSFVYSRGVPSRAFTDWTTALLYAAVREYDATDAIVVLGINDLLNAGTMDYASLIARANTVYDDLANVGVRVHAGNITPCGLTGEEELVRSLFNIWLLAENATSPTTVIDLATAVYDPATPGQLLAANDYGDGVHLTDAGYVLIGDAIADALELP